MKFSKIGTDDTPKAYLIKSDDGSDTFIGIVNHNKGITTLVDRFIIGDRDYCNVREYLKVGDTNNMDTEKVDGSFL